MKKIIVLGLLIILFVNFYFFTVKNWSVYTRPFYPERHKVLQDLFGQSQYVDAQSKINIPDEFFYALAAWNYGHGQNPALFNAEQPPLGKYFIYLTINFFNNETLTGPIFNLLCLVALFFLGLEVLKSKIWSLAMTTAFSFEHLFMVQAQYAPLLDNIQLFFILLSFLTFIYWLKEKITPLLPLLLLGGVVSVKFWITGAVIYISWLLYLLLAKKFKQIINLFLYTPIAIVPLIISYAPIFLAGDSFQRFLGIQKYIFVYHSGKIEFDPLTYFNLLILNNWRAGSVDWQITWPIILILSLVAVFKIFRQNKINSGIAVITCWFATYTVFLFFGSLLPRYLIPILPMMYLLSFYMIKEIYEYLD